MPSILMTGVAGFTGRHLLRFLADEEGHKLLGIDRQPPDSTEGEGDFRSLDLLDPTAVDEMIADFAPEWIIHLAGANSGTWEQLCDGNLRTTRNLLEGVRKARGAIRPRILLIGSAAEYGASAEQDEPIDENASLQPLNDYGRSKVEQARLMHQYAVEHRIQVLMARSFNLIGPGQGKGLVAGSWAHQIVRMENGSRGKCLRVGNLSTWRDFVDVRDAVRAYRALAEKGRAGQVYNVASGRPTSMEQLLQLFRQKSRVRFQLEQEEGNHPRGGQLIRVVGDATKLRQETGWEPEISLDKSVEDLLESCRKAPG